MHRASSSTWRSCRDDVWEPRRGPSANFERYLRREVLSQVAAPLVWGLDEVDRLFALRLRQRGLRPLPLLAQRAGARPDRPLARLTLAIAYATEAHLFITDLNQSPFNVGTRLALEDFTLEQVAELKRRYGAPAARRGRARRASTAWWAAIPTWCAAASTRWRRHGTDLAGLEAGAGRRRAIFGDHLRRLLAAPARDPSSARSCAAVLRGQPCPTPESFYRLRSAGVLIGDSERDARPRCRLYATYLATLHAVKL